MLRDIIEIDEALCNGCGNCIPGCHEGALQVVDGKARLISDLMCDGLGACVGHCPTGAMKVIKREAEPYNEETVMLEKIIPAGAATIKAHLQHLMDHNELEYCSQAIKILQSQGIEIPQLNSTTEGESPVEQAPANDPPPAHFGGCPGSAMKKLNSVEPAGAAPSGSPSSGLSRLEQWPVQLHLLNPSAPFLKGSDLLLASDCSAYAVGDFHDRYLKGKVLAIACPKLDQGLGNYQDKLTAMMDNAQINTITVLMMEVPCCSGLLQIVQQAAAQAERKVPIKKIIVSLEGKQMMEEWS